MWTLLCRARLLELENTRSQIGQGYVLVFRLRSEEDFTAVRRGGFEEREGGRWAAGRAARLSVDPIESIRPLWGDSTETLMVGTDLWSSKFGGGVCGIAANSAAEIRVETE